MDDTIRPCRPQRLGSQLLDKSQQRSVRPRRDTHLEHESSRRGASLQESRPFRRSILSRRPTIHNRIVRPRTSRSRVLGFVGLPGWLSPSGHGSTRVRVSVDGSITGWTIPSGRAVPNGWGASCLIRANSGVSGPTGTPTRSMREVDGEPPFKRAGPSEDLSSAGGLQSTIG